MGDMMWWPRGDGNSDILFRDAYGGNIAFDPDCCCVEEFTGCCGVGVPIPKTIWVAIYGDILPFPAPYCTSTPGICDHISSIQATLPAYDLKYDAALTSANGCGECWYSSPVYIPATIVCPNFGASPLQLWLVASVALTAPSPPGYQFFTAGFIAAGTGGDITTGREGLSFSYVHPEGDPPITQCHGLILTLTPTNNPSVPGASGDWCCMVNDGVGCLNPTNLTAVMTTSANNGIPPVCV